MKQRFPTNLMEQEFKSARSIDGLNVFLTDRHVHRIPDDNGLYHPNYIVYGVDFFGPSIVIRSALPNYKKVAVLYHELAHYHCHNSKCSCIGNMAEEEYHAFLYSMRQLLKKCKSDSKYNPCLLECMKTIFYTLIPAKYYTIDTSHYRTASKKLIKTATWRQCIKLFKGQIDLLLKSIEVKWRKIIRRRCKELGVPI